MTDSGKHWHRPDVDDVKRTTAEVEAELKALETRAEAALMDAGFVQRAWMWIKRHTAACAFGVILAIVVLELVIGG